MKRQHWLMCIAVLASVCVAMEPAPAQTGVGTNAPVEVGRCESGGRPGSRSCPIEGYLLEILSREGVESAMGALDALVATDEDARRDAHSFAHAIGIAAYTGEEEVGQVFARCTPAHQSGCYHGVVQSYFSEQMERRGGALGADLVNDLCRDHREDPEARWLLFQCAHGMGHGLVMLADRHLPASLEGCDLVGDDWEREACYGGVFMENIVHETVPHHSVGRPGETEHAGHAGTPAGAADHAHAHGAAASAATREEFPGLKAEDPLYPCSALPDRYLPACFQMQTSAILHFNGYDIPAAGEVCTAAPELYRATCFQSLGRDISAQTGQNHQRAIDLCGSAPQRYEPSCHVGYAKNLIDLTADPADGFDYCRRLPTGESKRICYVAVGEQIWVLNDAPERRAALCARSESAYVRDCRYGAGLMSGAALRGSDAGGRTGAE